MPLTPGASVIIALALLFAGADAASSTSVAGPSVADVARARLPRPRASFTAENPRQIRATLNAQLLEGPLALPKAMPCEAFELGDLKAWLMFLNGLAHPDLEGTLLRPGDRRRRIGSLDGGLKVDLAAEAAYAAEHPEVAEAVRDGWCADAAMAWVHRLTDGGRAEVADFLASGGGESLSALPLLPVEGGAAVHGPALRAAGHHETARRLEEAVSGR